MGWSKGRRNDEFLTSLWQDFGEAGGIDQVHQGRLQGAGLQRLHQVPHASGGSLAQGQPQEGENKEVVHLSRKGRFSVKTWNNGDW